MAGSAKRIFLCEGIVQGKVRLSLAVISLVYSHLGAIRALRRGVKARGSGVSTRRARKVRIHGRPPRAVVSLRTRPHTRSIRPRCRIRPPFCIRAGGNIRRFEQVRVRPPGTVRVPARTGLAERTLGARGSLVVGKARPGSVVPRLGGAAGHLDGNSAGHVAVCSAWAVREGGGGVAVAADWARGRSWRG